MQDHKAKLSRSMLLPSYGTFAFVSGVLLFAQILLVFALKPSLPWSIESCFTSGFTVAINDSSGQPHRIPELDLPSVRGELVFLLMMCAIGLNGLLCLFLLIRFRKSSAMLEAETCFACGHPLPGGDRCIECGVLQAAGVTALRRQWVRATGFVVGLFAANSALLLSFRTLSLECAVAWKPGTSTFCTPAVQGGRFAFAYMHRGVGRGAIWSREPFQAEAWYAIFAAANETPGDWQWHVLRVQHSGMPGESVPIFTELSSALGVTLSASQLKGFDGMAFEAMGSTSFPSPTWLAWPNPTPSAVILLSVIWLGVGVVAALAWTRIYRSRPALLTRLPDPLSSD